MSDNIPFELQIEIMTWLPVNSLIRFRSVSKSWKSLIGSSKFNADFITRHAHRQHLLISYKGEPYYMRTSFVSIVDDDTFPEHKVSVTTPKFLNQLHRSKLVGSSHGLFCLYGRYCYQKSANNTAVIWNPSIRKSVAIHVPNVIPYNENCIIGFGVCPITLDPKIVKISTFVKPLVIEKGSYTTDEVEVFTLSSRVWRSPSSNTLLLKHIETICPYSNVVIDGFIYWVANEMIAFGEEIFMIISFDLTSEEFKEIQLPDDELNLARYSYNDLWILKLRESLAMVGCMVKPNKQVYEVWMMEKNISKFSKLFTIDLPNASVHAMWWGLMGVSKTDQRIVVAMNYNKRSPALVVYEPCSEHIKDLEINGLFDSFSASSYTESLLLPDQSVSLIHC